MYGGIRTELDVYRPRKNTKVSSKYALGQDKIVKCSIYSCFYGYLGSKTLSKRGSNLIWLDFINEPKFNRKVSLQLKSLDSTGPRSYNLHYYSPASKITLLWRDHLEGKFY